MTLLAAPDRCADQRRYARFVGKLFVARAELCVWADDEHIRTAVVLAGTPFVVLGVLSMGYYDMVRFLAAGGSSVYNCAAWVLSSHASEVT